MTMFWLNSMDVEFISTHILTKRMTLVAMFVTLWKTFQLTSSRRGWLLIVGDLILLIIISTHILTKRMTANHRHIQLRHHISTHILTKRMTLGLWCSWSAGLHFNSHPHEEDDTENSYSPFTSAVISTHILTKRMTVYPLPQTLWLYYFNSHPHEEDDFVFLFRCLQCFISTHILTKRMTKSSRNCSNHH